MGNVWKDPVKMEQIMQKIRKVEHDKNFFYRALRALVCPECGELLQREVDEFYDDIPGTEVEYKCTSCEFTYETDTQREGGDFSI